MHQYNEIAPKTGMNMLLLICGTAKNESGSFSEIRGITKTRINSSMSDITIPILCRVGILIEDLPLPPACKIVGYNITDANRHPISTPKNALQITA
jgi:hypothetical protein